MDLHVTLGEGINIIIAIAGILGVYFSVTASRKKLLEEHMTMMVKIETLWTRYLHEQENK